MIPVDKKQKNHKKKKKEIIPKGLDMLSACTTAVLSQLSRQISTDVTKKVDEIFENVLQTRKDGLLTEQEVSIFFHFA